MYDKFKIDTKIIEFVNQFENRLKNDFLLLDEIYEYNQLKVLNAFIENKVSESSFIESTGYGYNDLGRDTIDAVYASVFNADSALVRQNFVSGTHALSLLIFAICRPNDNILSINGLPYDTLHSTLGLNNCESSIREFNISFNYVDLIDNDFNYDEIKNHILNNTKLVMIQRSRGYSYRYPISLKKIEKVVSFIKSIKKDIIIMVDNCYCEFIDKNEPLDLGVDVICGSLIKNPGGSLAKSGAYIAGKKEIIDKCADRLTAPGISKEVGVNFNQNRNVLQGLYFSPQIVNNSLKISKLFSAVLNNLKIDTIPKYNERQDDIVLAIKLDNKDLLEHFCNIIQSTSPVDSFLKPISEPMPGYENNVIMAAGCFVSGSSIELSCDAPVKAPFVVYLQGGITYYQGKLALMKVIQELNLI